MASAAVSGGVPQSHPFTCNTCQVAFRTSESQRGHMQSDWHRYNLKRRVASLPPLSSEIFAEKVLANKASQAATAARASYEKSCPACQKTYYSENAFINHLSSQKHKTNVARQQKVAAHGDDAASMMSSTFSLGDPIDTATHSVVDEDVEEEFSEVMNGMRKARLDDEDPLPRRPSRPHHSRAEEDSREPHPLSATTTSASGTESSIDGVKTAAEGPILNCLFCNFHSPSFSLNVHHMTRYHDLFIPEREFLTDLEGLIGYLHAKVTEGHECLYCGKAKHTTTGIMTHMRDRGHCKIAFDSEEEQIEIGQFYDFRATYSDPEAHDGDSDWSDESDEDKPSEKKGAKLGAKRGVQTTVDDDEDGDAPMGDEGWETDSTLSSVPTEEIGAVPIDDHSHRYASLHRSKHHSHADKRPHKSCDGWHSHAHHTPHAVYYDDFELHLPTGRSIGHRSMNKYWRQNLRSHPSAAERAERFAITEGTTIEGDEGDSDSDVDMDAPAPRPGNMQIQRGHDRGRQLATVLRANGGQGMIGVSDAKKKEVSKAEKRETGRARRQQERWKAGNERRNNFQKHYRDPLLQ